jgi:hypothetical protein
MKGLVHRSRICLSPGEAGRFLQQGFIKHKICTFHVYNMSSIAVVVKTGLRSHLMEIDGRPWGPSPGWGFVQADPIRAFTRALREELDRMRALMGLYAASFRAITGP